MNRIEHVATQAQTQTQIQAETPAQQPQPRFPRSLADVRRRAAPARSQPTATEAPIRTRRGTSGLAVAVAALAMPLLPTPALGAVASAGAAPDTPQAAKTQAQAHSQEQSQAKAHVQSWHQAQTHHQTQTRHQFPHRHVLPITGALTIQSWTTASGWTLTVPTGPAEAGLWDHVPTMRHDGDSVTWPAEVVLPIDHPRPVVLPDGTHGEIAAYRVSHASPRADDPDAPGTQTPENPAGSVGPVGPVGSDGSTSSTPSADTPPEWSSGGPSALRNARSRVVPMPLVPFARPANTKQMAAVPRPDADIPDGPVSGPSASERTGAANGVANPSAPSAFGCLGAGYPAGTDRYMVAHLRPMTDPMNVVVTPHRTACAARVDYLSQARA